MKYVLVIPDGCADEPQAALEGRTPLEAANIPGMREIATRGIVGRANHVPDEFTPGSEVANLSLLGYPPREFFPGRAPIEAAAQGITLGPEDWAIRCNLVTIEKQILRDFTAGHISTDESRQLLGTLQQQMGREELEFVTGVSYRNLLIYRGSKARPPFARDTVTTAPHDLTDLPIDDAYPRGPGSDLLAALMDRSQPILANHPVNTERRQNGKAVATHVWLWGLGQTPRLEPFEKRFGLRGAMITAVDLLRGLAKLVGWQTIDVPGATGYLDTDYAAKGRYACEALDAFDFVCVHIEATDEASHEGRGDEKILALERIDEAIVRPLLARLEQSGEYRILVTPDHPTFLRTKMHSRGYVPWTMCGTGILPDAATGYDEHTAAASRHCFDDGSRLMEFFLCR